MPRLRAHPPVETGQRYCRTGGSGAWLVVGLSEDHAGNPHARMEATGDRTRVITIALAALRDRRLYRRLNESETHDDHARHGCAAPDRAGSGEPA